MSANIPIANPDSDQRTSVSVAGPKASVKARPATGLKAKQAGTKASSRKRADPSPLSVFSASVDEAFADPLSMNDPAHGFLRNWDTIDRSLNMLPDRWGHQRSALDLKQTFRR